MTPVRYQNENLDLSRYGGLAVDMGFGFMGTNSEHHKEPGDIVTVSCKHPSHPLICLKPIVSLVFGMRVALERLFLVI